MKTASLIGKVNTVTIFILATPPKINETQSFLGRQHIFKSEKRCYIHTNNDEIDSFIGIPLILTPFLDVLPQLMRHLLTKDKNV